MLRIKESHCKPWFHCQDALESEISAIHEGLSLSMQRSDLPIVGQSDSSIVIAALTNDLLRFEYLYMDHDNEEELPRRPPVSRFRHQFALIAPGAACMGRSI